VAAETPYHIEWARQFDSTKSDESHSVAVGVFGNAYIAGVTEVDAAGTDGFLAKYDVSGDLLWSRQIGTIAWDECAAVAVDSADNSLVTGVTRGELAGTNLGEIDAYLIKHDPFGNLLWSRQIGTRFDEEITSVAVDGFDNIYISGHTDGSLAGENAGDADIFLSKYSASGGLLWSRQFGTFTSDFNSTVAVDKAGNAFVTGNTFGDLVTTNAGFVDGFLFKYDVSGNLLWSRQFGTALPDFSYAVAVDNDGNAFVSGSTSGDLGGTNQGDHDAFLLKFDESGNLLWSQQLGTRDGDVNISIAVDVAGAAYILGSSRGDLVGSGAGGSIGFLAKYDATGALLGVQHMSASDLDFGHSIAIGQTSSLFVTGGTGATAIISDPSDAFLIKFAIPEPSSLLLVSMALFAVACRRSR